MSEFIEIGQIVAPHGIQGWVKVTPASDVSSLMRYKDFYDKDGHKMPIFLKKVVKGQAFATLENVTDRNQAQSWCGKRLYIRRTDLMPLPTGEYYICDLVGLDAVLTSGEKLGRVVSVENYGAGDILTITDSAGAETLVILSKQNVPQVCIDKGFLTVDLPKMVGADE